MTPSKTAFGSLGLLCGLSFLLAACPAALDDRCADSACVASEGGSVPDVNSLDGGVDAPVDPCVNTPTDPKCLDESTAFFVSAAANAAAADGSRAKPFATVTAALGAINDTRKRVYVCEGTYSEKVAIQKPVSILGGLACDWTKKGANPRIAPAKGVAISIVKTIGVTITDVDVDGSADSQLDGDSAIAVFVSESKAVLLRRVNAKAGPGTKGAAGANGDVSPNYTGALAPKGLDTSTGAGAEAPACGTCADGSFSIGGKGAAAMGQPLPGKATPIVGSNNAGGTLGGVCSDGKLGASGAAGIAAAGSDRPGSAKVMGWDSPVLAKKGANGNPGQGGGGAGSTDTLGGGSGGCGGCGGTGGGPGGNGGSSIALLSFDSDVVVENSTLTSAAGAIGGGGGNGQNGQIRGPAGGGVCSGGVGGHGAGGGGGGGGAGGHSAAIAHSGKAPTTTASILKPGLGGDLGPGGGAGTSTGNPGMPGSPGAHGSAAEVLPL